MRHRWPHCLTAVRVPIVASANRPTPPPTSSSESDGIATTMATESSTGPAVDPRVTMPETTAPAPSSSSALSAEISLVVQARVQGYTKATFSVSTFRGALASTLGVPAESVAVLSVEDLPARRNAVAGVSVTSVAMFQAGHGSDAAAAANRLAPEALTQNLRAGGMTAASVAALVSTISDPAASSTPPATTPAALATAGSRSDSAVIMIGPSPSVCDREAREFDATWRCETDFADNAAT
jgi:hypothetical protein